MLRILILILALASGGCGLLLEFDDGAPPCGRGRGCPADASCQINTCIDDGTLAHGMTCSAERQCQPALSCVEQLFSCQFTCENFFEPCGEGPGQCVPMMKQNGGWLGVCREPECARDDDCGTVGKACLAGSCWDACQLNWSSGAAFDNCADHDFTTWCADIGRLVCLPVDPRALRRELGQGCSNPDLPCGDGLACIDHTCRSYCRIPNASSDCAIDEVCCATHAQGQSADLGVCLSACK